MPRKDFDCNVTDNGVPFMVYGEIDIDGLPLIERVYVDGSDLNIWPCLEAGYESNTGLGGRIYTAVEEQIVSRDAYDRIHSYDDHEEFEGVPV